MIMQKNQWAQWALPAHKFIFCPFRLMIFYRHMGKNGKKMMSSDLPILKIGF